MFFSTKPENLNTADTEWWWGWEKIPSNIKKASLRTSSRGRLLVWWLAHGWTKWKPRSQKSTTFLRDLCCGRNPMSGLKNSLLNVKDSELSSGHVFLPVTWGNSQGNYTKCPFQMWPWNTDLPRTQKTWRTMDKEVPLDKHVMCLPIFP